MAAFRKFNPRAALKKTRWNSDFVATVAVVAASPSRNEKIGGQNCQGPLATLATVATNEACSPFVPSKPESEKSEGTLATTATSATNRLGNSIPHEFHHAFATLELGCPEHVETNRWLVMLMDAERFLKMWNRQAEAFGWTVSELFGLHTPPETPAPNYCRMARYDCTGLLWLLSGNPVIALSATTATIRHDSGSITIYRKERKPALGPLGDCLDDFI